MIRAEPGSGPQRHRRTAPWGGSGRPTRNRASQCLVWCALAAALLSGCGGGGGDGDGDGSASTPRPSATRSVEVPEPTRSVEVPEPTRTPRPTEDTKPTEDTEAPRPDRTQEPGDGAGQGGDQEGTDQEGSDQEGSGEGDADAEAQQSAEPQPTPQEATPDEAAGTPAWVWWLLAALVLAAVAGTIAAVVHARRKHRWREELAATEGEVGWFARELLPDLRRSTSLDQVVGGWHIGSARVEAAEDRLTALEDTAPTDEDRTRARTLRDAVRLARQRLDSLTLVAPHDSWALDLDEMVADLEVALGPPGPPPNRAPQP